MPFDSYSKGLEFEDKLRLVLSRLVALHPELVRVADHEPLELYNGTNVIPDFGLEFKHPIMTWRFLIECQNRNTTDQDLGNKIFRLRSLSRRNQVIFVHGSSIGKTVRDSLDGDGVIIMSFQEFVAFIVRIHDDLSLPRHDGPQDPDSDFADFLDEGQSFDQFPPKIS